MFVKPIIISFICFGLAGNSFADSQFMRMLSDLDPLPKVHYSFPLPAELLNDPNSRLLYETARITNAVSISGEWTTMVQVKNAVYTCARINRTDPDIPASIGINYSPYHRELDPNVPPTYRGETYQKELERFESRLTTIKRWIDGYNEYYDSDVQVGAILLDMERFHARPGHERWQEGMRDALDAVHKLAADIYPNARIEWYGRGIRWMSTDPPWVRSAYFTGKEEHMPSLSCMLYFVPEIERTLEMYRRTAKLADELGIEEVTPWIALGSGYRRCLERTFRWDFDWDYDVIYSYLLGRYINHPWFGTPERAERFAPFNRATVVIFYPKPFDERTLGWGKHFVAYVRGAHGIQNLSDIEQ